MKSGPLPSREYCIFTQLTNSNVLGKSPIRDSNNRETGNCYWWIWQKYNTHVTVKDHIYEYMLTNTDNELYCYSKEFHSHLPFDRPCFMRSTIQDQKSFICDEY
jgi:hypothetical protein